jgi:urease
LNRPEAVALIAFQLHEFIRDGRHSVAELMDLGKKFLGRRHVMGESHRMDCRIQLMVDGVAEGIHDVQVEGTFPVSCHFLSF